MEDLDPRMLVDLLRDRINPDRSLGQHFILDENIISEAVNMSNQIGKEVTKESHILEIGPGPGSLTLYLLRKGAKNVLDRTNYILFEHHYDDMIIKNYFFSDIHHFLRENNFTQLYKSKMPFRKTFEYIYVNKLAKL